MYPMLNTWINDPTPVTTRSMTADNGSTWNAASMRSVPTGIHSHRRSTYGPLWAASAPTTPAATPNAANRTPVPTIDTSRLAVGRHNASAPFTRNPASGSAGTSHTRPRVRSISLSGR
jgi:hypothetical protein